MPSRKPWILPAAADASMRSLVSSMTHWSWYPNHASLSPLASKGMTTAAKRTKKYFLNRDRRGMTTFEAAARGALEKDRHVRIHGLKRGSSVRKAILTPYWPRVKGKKSGSALLLPSHLHSITLSA